MTMVYNILRRLLIVSAFVLERDIANVNCKLNQRHNNLTESSVKILGVSNAQLEEPVGQYKPNSNEFAVENNRNRSGPGPSNRVYSEGSVVQLDENKKSQFLVELDNDKSNSFHESKSRVTRSAGDGNATTKNQLLPLKDSVKTLENSSWTSRQDDYEDPSCRHKCGRLRVTPCSCDYTCFPLKTCCEDVALECPTLREEARGVLGNDMVDGLDLTTCDLATKSFIIDKCVWPRKPSDLVLDLDDMISIIQARAVVYDHNTGLVFRNRSIHNCYSNNSVGLQQWAAYFLLADHGSLKYQVFNPKTSLAALKPEKAKFYPQSSVVVGHKCRSVIESCNKELEYLDENGLCGEYVSHYRSTDSKAKFDNLEPVYGNRHCYACNMNGTDGTHGLIIDTVGDSAIRSPPFSILLDVSESDTGTQVSLSTSMMTIGSEWTCDFGDSVTPSTSKDPTTDSSLQCRAVSCGYHSSVYQEKCMKFCSVFSIMRHHPYFPFNARQTLQFAKFVSCYLERGNWSFALQFGGNHVYDIKAVNNLELYESIFAERYGIEYDKDQYFLVVLDYLCPIIVKSNELVRQHQLEAIEDAVRYWYIENKFVVEDRENYVMYFRNGTRESPQYEKTIGMETNSVGIDGDESFGNNHLKNDDADYEYLTAEEQSGASSSRGYPRTLLLGVQAARIGSGIYFSKHGRLTPLGSSERASAGVNHQGLARCYGYTNDAFEANGEAGNDGIGAATYNPGVRRIVLLTMVGLTFF